MANTKMAVLASGLFVVSAPVWAGSCDSSDVEESKEGDLAGLTSFSAVSGSDVTLVSGDLASAYFQAFGTRPGGRIGLRLTSSVPAKVEDQKRYLDHELQLKDGGLLNLSFSFWSTAAVLPNKGCEIGGRNLKVDRHYFGTDYTKTQFYFLNGLGVRAIKRAGDGGSEEKTSAAGYAYAGFGVDAYLLDPSKPKDGSGLLDLSFRFTYNRLNSDFAKPLYEGSGIENVVSGAVALKFNITGTVAASLEYSTPLAGAKSFGMSDVALFSLSYAPKKQVEEGKAATATFL